MAKRSSKSNVPAKRTIALIADELGSADAEIQSLLVSLTPLQDRAKKLRVELLEALNLPADQPGMAEGLSFLITVGAASNQRKITDMVKLRKLLGDEKFFANATIALGKLDDLLPEELRGQVLKTERTGPRTMTIVPRKVNAAGKN